jgi:ABC-type transport system involved in multi-copper enzyme maturation permease subunit
MFRQLLWKEWREQQWKLIFGTVMLVFFTTTLMATQLSTGREVLVAVWIIGGLVMALYSAMGVFAPEISNGTQVFLVTKPIQPWKIFWGKWFIGWLNFAVPMLICSLGLATIILLHPEGRFFELKYIAKGTFAGVGFGTMLYTMTCCFAPRKSGEAMTGFTGMGICVAIMLHMMTVVAFSTIESRSSFANEFILYLNPVSWCYLIAKMNDNMHLWLMIIEQSILFILTIILGYCKWKRS